MSTVYDIAVVDIDELGTTFGVTAVDVDIEALTGPEIDLVEVLLPHEPTVIEVNTGAIYAQSNLHPLLSVSVIAAVYNEDTGWPARSSIPGSAGAFAVNWFGPTSAGFPPTAVDNDIFTEVQP